MAKFRDVAAFDGSASSGYTMLPWRFTSLDDDRYVATNMAGEYIAMSRAEVSDFASGGLPASDGLYNDLKSKHFLIDADTDVAVDLLALKVRTKLAPLANFTGLHIFVTTLRCEHSCPYCQVSRANDDKRDRGRRKAALLEDMRHGVSPLSRERVTLSFLHSRFFVQLERFRGM